MDAPSSPIDTALAQPTRARLFALLGELRGPASTDELAERVGLHPNGVRVHLERLEQAGLVQRRLERVPRGRPRHAWTISAGARPGGEPPTGYADLARWLVRTLAGTRTPVRQIEAAGRQIGRELAGTAAVGSEPEQRFNTMLSGLGFQPERTEASGDRMTVCLRNCPYREAVRERQPLVCGFHRGLTRGLLDGIDPKTKLVGFVPKNPDEAGCLLELRGPLAGAPSE